MAIYDCIVETYIIVILLLALKDGCFYKNKTFKINLMKKFHCSNDLSQRTFSTPRFYKEMEDVITPAGLAFCQTEWDDSVRQCCHGRLGL